MQIVSLTASCAILSLLSTGGIYVWEWFLLKRNESVGEDTTVL